MACEPKQSSVSYEDYIANHRKETHEFMNVSDDSPFVGVDSTISLNYYPVDQKFRVIATIKRIQNGGQLTLGTSDGVSRVYDKHALLEFEINEKPLQLLVLKGEKSEGLFLAFSDLTNDNTTYGGGRYINLNFSDQAEKITLDFNLAYNPYCEYNATYSCPLPPLENYLKVAIAAGEKLYK
ncbi:hypothetical protein SAMN04488029_3118 [Reichenbachiella faecimaris]|uniref:DUF1684 domain-containing protein n=2 Tax=Reichenbachiella faecimaris TaxID=692418 RepID=A0A1W2GKK8_REIFA|nr:hypothetical protein SAMN04488029_3118 [Reichenbachiella faecimaris]